MHWRWFDLLTATIKHSNSNENTNYAVVAHKAHCGIFIKGAVLSSYGHITLQRQQHADRDCSIWNLNYKLTSGSSSSNSSSSRCSSSSDSFWSSSSSSMSLYFSISFLNTDMMDCTPGNIYGVTSRQHVNKLSCKRRLLTGLNVVEYLALTHKINDK